jgi:hypothetical protein
MRLTDKSATSMPAPTISSFVHDELTCSGFSEPGRVASASSVLNRMWRAAETSWFAYGSLLLLQLKVIWGDWLYRDLTPGDTAHYFVLAYQWYQDLKVDIVWSPLYTAFYGALFHLAPDAYTVTELHRLLTVFTVSALVLAVMRALLPHGIAWLIAAWWTLMHTNFNVMYEAHLFGLIPGLLAAIIVSRASPWATGAGFAVLVGATLLVRFEYAVAAAIFGGVCILVDGQRLGRTGQNWMQRVRRLVSAYLLPLLAVSCLVAFFYSRSIIPHAQILPGVSEKAGFAFSQFYALGHLQRHPEWNKNPFTNFNELIQSDFGTSGWISYSDALRRNTGAVMFHAGWNLRLLPSAIQALLFNATSGSINPDLMSVRLEDHGALYFTVGLCLLLVLGVCLLLRHPTWLQEWLRVRMLTVAVLVALAASSLAIVVTISPRPEYLFGLAIFILACAGLSLGIVLRPWLGGSGVRHWELAPAVAVLVLAPPYYSDSANRPPRTVLQEYQNLAPFAEWIADRDVVFLKGANPEEMSFYIAPELAARALDYRVLDEMHDKESVERVLHRHGVTLFYLDQDLLSRLRHEPQSSAFLDAPEAAGWKVLALQQGTHSDWMLLRRLQAPTLSGGHQPATRSR